MPLVPVESIDDPRLASYRQLSERNLTRQSGLFVAEGDKVVERLIDSRYEVASIFAEPEFAERYAPRVPQDTPIYVASRQLLETTIGFNFHRGVLACGKRQPGPTVTSVVRNLPLPLGQGRGEGFINSRCDDPHPKPLPVGEGTNCCTLVVCPDVQDPTNLGSIIRTTAAFGCAALILGEKCADPFSRRVLRVSMGSALYLPIVESRTLATDMHELVAAGFELVATVVGDATAEPLTSFRRRPRTAILFGSEGHGLSAECLALCHRRVTIPMQLGVDSLNVAVAAAVVLYEVEKEKAG